jgi:hypothetical protein
MWRLHYFSLMAVQDHPDQYDSMLVATGFAVLAVYSFVLRVKVLLWLCVFICRFSSGTACQAVLPGTAAAACTKAGVYTPCVGINGLEPQFRNLHLHRCEAGTSMSCHGSACGWKVWGVCMGVCIHAAVAKLGGAPLWVPPQRPSGQPVHSAAAMPLCSVRHFGKAAM